MPCTTPFLVPRLLSPSLSLLPLLHSEDPIQSDNIPSMARLIYTHLGFGSSPSHSPPSSHRLPAAVSACEESPFFSAKYWTQRQQEWKEEEKHKPRMMMVTEMAEKKRRTNHDAFLLDAKRLKTEHGDLKKDRIGERVAALQKLVSPYGKSDTASVLTEATAYIKFLHEQLQVLSSPYLCSSPNSKSRPGEWLSLRSRGLCLMPLATTVLIARSNGADIWAPVSK